MGGRHCEPHKQPMFPKCYNKGLGIPVPESARIIPIVPEALVLISQQFLRDGKKNGQCENVGREIGEGRWDEWKEWEE